MGWWSELALIAEILQNKMLWRSSVISFLKPINYLLCVYTDWNVSSCCWSLDFSFWTCSDYCPALCSGTKSCAICNGRLICFKGNQLWVQSRRAIRRIWGQAWDKGRVCQPLQSLCWHLNLWLHLFSLGGPWCPRELHPLQGNLRRLSLPLQTDLRPPWHLWLLSGNPRGKLLRHNQVF